VEVTPQDPSVQWVLKVPLEMMVQQDHKGFKVMMVFREFRVLRVLQEMMVRWVLRDRWGHFHLEHNQER
jgi:hypothetical protein